MRCAVAIFAKTIGLSDVKTRLAADLGTEKAEAFFKLSVDCVEAFVSEAGEAFPEVLSPVWAIAEEKALDHWKARSFPSLWTGEGGLGTRLASVSSELFKHHDGVLMIGTDSPQLKPTVLLEATSLLSSGFCDVVVGPAVDGGFYLFGSVTPIPHEIWEAVEYSHENTLSDLSKRLEELGARIRRLEPQQDVDTISDLSALYSSLSAEHSGLNSSKKALLHWLAEHKSYFESAV